MPKAKDEGVSADINWHPYHRDPAGDVYFCSDDGVYFRVSSYRLAQASTVFAGMLQVANAGGTKRQREVIEIAYNSKVVEAFLDLVTSPKPLLVQLPFLHMAHLRELVRMYECQAITNAVETFFRDACKLDPIPAFLYASSQNDVRLARDAMKLVKVNYGYSNTFGGFGGFWKFVDSIRTEWQLPLLRVIFGGTGNSEIKMATSWSSVADQFRPQ